MNVKNDKDKNYFNLDKKTLNQNEFLVPYDLPPKKYTPNGKYL